jgi:hypothetical protein
VITEARKMAIILSAARAPVAERGPTHVIPMSAGGVAVTRTRRLETGLVVEDVVLYSQHLELVEDGRNPYNT